MYIAWCFFSTGFCSMQHDASVFGFNVSRVTASRKQPKSESGTATPDPFVCETDTGFQSLRPQVETFLLPLSSVLHSGFRRTRTSSFCQPCLQCSCASRRLPLWTGRNNIFPWESLWSNLIEPQKCSNCILIKCYCTKQETALHVCMKFVCMKNKSPLSRSPDWTTSLKHS